MIATPDVSHLRRQDWQHVYEPAEDTFALLDALEQDAAALCEAAPRLVVEIGSGSGTVSAFVATLLSSGSGSGSGSGSTAAFICTDINLHAAQATKATGLANSRPGNPIHLAPVLTPLLQALRPRCDGLIDLLIFNPPYVPTTNEEEREAQRTAAIEGSWAGGAYGTALVEQLLPMLPVRMCLSQWSGTGAAFVSTRRQNRPPFAEADDWPPPLPVPCTHRRFWHQAAPSTSWPSSKTIQTPSSIG